MLATLQKRWLLWGIYYVWMVLCLKEKKKKNAVPDIFHIKSSPVVFN